MSVTRIVVINDTSQALGGTTALALLSVQLLRKQGFAVTYICGDDGNNDELVAQGVEVIAAGNVSLLQKGRADALIHGVYDSKTRDLVANYIDAHDTIGTIYHVHGWAQILSPSIFQALAVVASRTFVHAHDMFLACPNGVYMDYPRDQVCLRRPLSASCILTNCDKRSYPQKLWRLVRHKALFNCFDQKLPWAGIVMIHPAMRERMERAGYSPNLLHVVRNPVSPYSDTRIRAENNQGVIYVGRLERDKGVLDIVDAATRAGLELTLVGDGVLREELQKSHPEIRITGWQPREAIGKFISTARVLVMPSHHPEPFALVIPEAVQSGLPVIMSETALMSAEIVEARLGLSVDIFEKGALDQALVTIRDMPNQSMRELSERGFSGQAQLALTPDIWADQLLELYHEALSG
ncbi:MAG: glycosyltransferase [Rhodobacteraceae bacterium]|nr:glycosyltransferase [Paracoccaceae bacterium]